MESNNTNYKLNDVVNWYFSNYGIPYTVEHYIEIRQAYYEQQHPVGTTSSMS